MRYCKLFLTFSIRSIFVFNVILYHSNIFCRISVFSLCRKTLIRQNGLNFFLLISLQYLFEKITINKQGRFNFILFSKINTIESINPLETIGFDDKVYTVICSWSSNYCWYRGNIFRDFLVIPIRIHGECILGSRYKVICLACSSLQPYNSVLPIA